MKPAFRLEPYAHQQREWDENRDLRSRMLLWQMRTGKTKATIDLACYWREEYQIDGVIIFAPNGVHENWLLRELPKHHWSRIQYNTIKYSTALTRNKLWQKRTTKALGSDQFLWLAINNESMILPESKKLIKQFIKCKPRFLIIFDEAHDFRVPGAKRTKMACSLAPLAFGVRALTGTAVLNSPLHAFSEYELLGKEALGFSKFSDFQRFFAIFETRRRRVGSSAGRGRQYQHLVDYKNLKVLRKRMSEWSSVVLREDCDDLPEILQDIRYITPTPAQKKIYNDLLEGFITEIGEEDISIGEETIRLMKLQQVLSGFVIDEDGIIHRLQGKNPKIEALVEELSIATGKTIVWCQFREDIRMVTERLTLEKIPFVEYHGGIANKERQISIDRFQMDREVKVFVGQPASGGQGINLSAANHVIWYSHTFNAIHRKQADERATLIGGHKITMLDLVVPGAVDSYIRMKVADKINISSELAGKNMKQLLERVKIN